MVERLYRVEEAAREILRIGRTRLYEMLAREEIESIVIGDRSRRIPESALQAYIDRMRGEQSSTEQSSTEQSSLDRRR